MKISPVASSDFFNVAFHHHFHSVVVNTVFCIGRAGDRPGRKCSLSANCVLLLFLLQIKEFFVKFGYQREVQAVMSAEVVEAETKSMPNLRLM